MADQVRTDLLVVAHRRWYVDLQISLGGVPKSSRQFPIGRNQ
jgi:hypothetical protein